MNISKRVTRGIEFLSEKLDTAWWMHIDLDTLDLENGEHCVVGQLNRAGLLEGPGHNVYENFPYLDAISKLGFIGPHEGCDTSDSWRYGFTGSDKDYMADVDFFYEKLTAEWRARLGGMIMASQVLMQAEPVLTNGTTPITVREAMRALVELDPNQFVVLNLRES